MIRHAGDWKRYANDFLLVHGCEFTTDECAVIERFINRIAYEDPEELQKAATEKRAAIARMYEAAKKKP